MKSLFSSSWKSSIQPRRQRKYLANAPLHARQKLVSVHLSKDLRKQYGRRSLPVRKGDEVKVLRGSHSGLKAKVSDVNVAKIRIYLEGQLRNKAAGKKAAIPFHPSNLLLTDAKLGDKKREAIISRSKSGKIGVKK